MKTFTRLLLAVPILAALVSPALADSRTGIYYDAAQPGRGYAIEVNDAGRFFFASYHFHLTREPSFWVASGTVRDNTAAAPLVEMRFGQQLGGVCREPMSWDEDVGPMTFDFAGKRLAWPGGDTPMDRLDVSADAPDVAAPERGFWFDASCPGTGYFLEPQGSALIVAAFMYEPSGEASWRFSALQRVAAGVYAGDLLRCSGGQRYEDEPYQAPKCKAVEGVTLTFGDSVVRLTMESGAQISLERFKF